MQGEKKERWMELCEQAAKEQDPEELLKLVEQINDLLEEKERRLGVLPSKPTNPNLMQAHPSLICGGHDEEFSLA
jgi:hypothetical protein